MSPTQRHIFDEIPKWVQGQPGRANFIIQKLGENNRPFLITSYQALKPFKLAASVVRLCQGELISLYECDFQGPFIEADIVSLDGGAI